jgi:hypothetical protein
MRKTIIFLLMLPVAPALRSQTPSAVPVTHIRPAVEQLKTDAKPPNAPFPQQHTYSLRRIGKLPSHLKNLNPTPAVRIDRPNNTLQKTTRTATGKKILPLAGILCLLPVGLYYWRHKKSKTATPETIKQTMQVKTPETPIKTDRKNSASTTAPDHSFVLKLADEIALTERHLALVNSNTKSLQPLTRSIGKLKDALAANGYEIPDLLGKPFNEELKAIIINTIPDKTLEKGATRITKIIQPQVNYNKKMIQPAQIEIHLG